MDTSQFDRFAPALKRVGSQGANSADFRLGTEGTYELRYIPFEHVNQRARLVIVGITPGPTQIELAYGAAQALLAAGMNKECILEEVKKTGGFGGPSMRPNLLRMLRHFHFEKLLGINDVASLWTSDAHLLHATSVVPYAAFRNGKPFNGKFEAVLRSPMLRQCFLDHFVGSLPHLRDDALYVALGKTPMAALSWCVERGHLRKDQVLGAFCHPSSQGGSATAYYLGEKTLADLSPSDPIRYRVRALDEDYHHVHEAVRAILAMIDNQRLKSAA